jgi:hypothetical protein
MNESVMQRPAMTSRKNTQSRPAQRAKRSSAFYGNLTLTVLIAIGWLLRERELINPEEGLGYWLGITGGSLMLLLLLYPLRKRMRLMQRLGATRFWFRMHMILGLVGPLLILYHSNYQLGSFNSRVAFFSMLLVAGSGVVGRHFYERIHRGLYGRKTSLRELQNELGDAVQQSRGMAKVMPGLVTRLNKLSDELRGCEITQSLSIGRSFRWTISHHFMRLSLGFTARRELRVAVAAGQMDISDFHQANDAAARYISSYTNLIGRVAQFSFYERMFALWHVFHLPLFFMMVITALFHVLAVHMY